MRHNPIIYEIDDEFEPFPLAPFVLTIIILALIFATGCSAMIAEAGRTLLTDEEVKRAFVEMAGDAAKRLLTDEEVKKAFAEMAAVAAKEATGPGTPWGKLAGAATAILVGGGGVMHRMQMRDRRKFHGENGK